MQYFVLYNHGCNFILSITAAEAAADLKLFRRTQYRKHVIDQSGLLENKWHKKVSTR